MDLLIPVSDEFLSQVPGEKGGSQSIEIEQMNRILAAAPPRLLSPQEEAARIPLKGWPDCMRNALS